MKHYLGEGVYVDWDGYELVLTTENGISVTNRIVLETAVYFNLVEYVEQMKTHRIEELDKIHAKDK